MIDKAACVLGKEDLKDWTRFPRWRNCVKSEVGVWPQKEKPGDRQNTQGTEETGHSCPECVLVTVCMLLLLSRSVVSDSVRPQRRQPTRLRGPWDSPGKNTGVGCHFLLQCIKVKSESEVAQSCPTQRPHGLQPTRLLHPWDFPGKSTGVGCHWEMIKICSDSECQVP